MKLTAGEKLFTTLFTKIILLTAMVGAAVRIVLLCNVSAPEGTGFGLTDYMATFSLGLVNDICAATLGFVFMWLYCVSMIPGKYRKAPAAAILALLCFTLLYLICFNTQLEEFNRGLNRVVKIILAYWIATFTLRLLCKRVREPWSRIWFAIILCIYVITIYFNAASEYFFWAEFNVRYNFIAVDYLVYTNEVVGNIMESYSIVPLMIGVAAVSAFTVWALFRNEIRRCTDLYESRWKLTCSAAYVVLAVMAAWLLKFDTRFQQSENAYYNEVQANGVYKFYQAFLKNDLEFPRFYQTIPRNEAEAIVHGIYGSQGENTRHISSDTTYSPRNIILITVESMSAEFMARYGNTEGLTPALDSLSRESLTFDRTFATGNRTVRGLEAVTLSLPPCPGQSIVKRPDNTGRSSTGQILRDKGYDTYYFYGGNSYFDNMGSFFGNNGYTVVDLKDYTPEEITFKNIWGVCDEDSYNKVITTLDRRHESARGNAPVFAHVMTISNHRPYTYPDGRISISPETKTRAGGVMYTDYALGRFINEARRRPWGKEAVFVIVADHCASSAGKTELPLEKYHIPAMIHSPGFIAPASVDKTVSQIDIMPTLFALLGMDYDSRFFGTDVLADDYSPRAFLATYQDLGYLSGDTLTVLSPMQRIRQLRIEPTGDNPLNTVPVTDIDSTKARRATALYQTSALWNQPRF